MTGMSYKLKCLEGRVGWIAVELVGGEGRAKWKWLCSHSHGIQEEADKTAQHYYNGDQCTCVCAVFN